MKETVSRRHSLLPVIHSIQQGCARRHTSTRYKVLVVGDAGAGKSSLIQRYVHNFFSEQNFINGSTLGVDFSLKLIRDMDDHEIQLQLWDLSGDDRFSAMTRAYYRQAVGALVVFDLTNADSYHHAVSKWKILMDNHCTLPGDPPDRPIPIILVGTKVDLVQDPQLPDDVALSQAIHAAGFIHKWFKCSGQPFLPFHPVQRFISMISAKTGEGIGDVMTQMIQYLKVVQPRLHGNDVISLPGPKDASHLGPLARKEGCLCPCVL